MKKTVAIYYSSAGKTFYKRIVPVAQTFTSPVCPGYIFAIHRAANRRSWGVVEMSSGLSVCKDKISAQLAKVQTLQMLEALSQSQPGDFIASAIRLAKDRYSDLKEIPAPEDAP